MKIITEYIELSTKGQAEVVDITRKVADLLKSSGLNAGIVNLNVYGSTAGLTTCEYEPGLVKDIKEIFEKLIPQEKRYHHNDTWGDGNGHSHLRASLLGATLTLPFNNNALILGTWQQIIFIDFDNRPRERKLVLQFIGE